MSLCFLLALVIVLMQKASDPKHVRNAFSALGVPFEREVIASTDSDLAKPALIGVGNESVSQASRDGASAPDAAVSDAEQADAKWRKTCEDLVPRLLGELSPAQLLELSQRWFAVEGAASLDPLLDDLRRSGEQAAEQLDSIAAQLSGGTTQAAEQGVDAANDGDSWEDQFDRFGQQWENLWCSISQGDPPTGVEPHLASVINRYLDSKLALQMRDAAPWTHQETVPFLRLLQRCQSRTESATQLNPPLLSTLQLEAELSVYRGQPIRFRGEVRQAEYVPRESNAFGIAGYWSLWLRGEDGAAQPVAVYTTHSIGKQLAAVLEQEQFPLVEVLGLVGKRLAYASQEGVEVAPTIFATSLLQFAQEAPPIPAVAEGELASKLAWAGILAVLVSAIILGPILANRRSSRRDQPGIRDKRTGRNGTAGTALLLLASLLPMHGFAQSSDREPVDSIPPWANADEQISIRAMLIERVTAAFAPADLDAVQLYLAGDSEQIPDAFLKCMQRIKQIGWTRVTSAAWQFELPAVDLQMKTTELQGQVRLAMPVKLNENQQLWFEKEPGDHLFRLEVVGGDGELHSVFCESVPSQWMQTAQLKQPVIVQGLSLLQSGSDSTPLCLFAKRPQWLLEPSTPATEWLPAVEPRLYQLGVLGWDLANIDVIRASNQKAIQAEESQAYFSLMRILASKPQLSSERVTAMQALAKPKELVGAPVEWSVRLVSGSVVDVASDETATRLGADRYYQLDGFVDIGNQVVHYKMSNEGDAPEVVDFEKEFPVTIVMQADSPYIPSSVTEENAKSWEIGQYVTVSGVFYRLWSYQSERLEKKSATARQTAPLIIASALTPSTPKIRQSQASVGWFGYALCLATLAILGGILFSVFKPEPRIRRR